ncbi:molybdenum cofactor biosynthesis protein [Coprinopsis sp. MPI-PUGE-AT-0042]|nr:molybdenum cofactor biosynthesis protein [Coprinopsis sp. MPI-PUGE-AT-0042]
MASKIVAAILTVSDTASQDAKADKSGPTIRQILSDRGDIVVHDTTCSIVADDVDSVYKTVKAWAEQTDPKIDWIITTGGTGFGIRDVTPEALEPVLDRKAPGLVHLLLSSSLKHTPLAALSRPVAGTAGKTLITALPGSPRAVKQCLDALFAGGVVYHAIDLVRGGTGQEVHAAMGASHGSTSESQETSSSDGQGHRGHRHGHGHDHSHGRHSHSPGHRRVTRTGHSHSHGHRHDHIHEHRPPQPRTSEILSHDPNAPASARHRHSPYALIPLDEALKLVDEKVERLPIIERIVDHTLGGFSLAEDVAAPRNVPGTATTSVDGYALRSTDPPGVYKVVTSSTHKLSDVVPEGTIYRINTGGPLPAGTDNLSTHPDVDGVSGEEKEVETLAQIPAGENVRQPGSDVRKGDLVMQAGDVITSVGGEIGTLAFVGKQQVKVYKKPVVALLSTGNELVDLQGSDVTQGSDSWGGIYDTNRPALQAVLQGLGYEVVDFGIVPDTVDAHAAAIQGGLDKADIILTTGGTSMGPTDLLKPVIERNFNGIIHFGRVAMKPGKPTTFATIPVQSPGSSEEVQKPIFALPGNPASALVTFYVFVLPALRRMGGWPEESTKLPRVRVLVKTPMQRDSRLEFHRVIIKVNLSTGSLEAYSTGGQRSSRVASLNGANGLVILPALQEGEKDGAIGIDTWAYAYVIGELQGL